jgi:hypothetical protein
MFGALLPYLPLSGATKAGVSNQRLRVFQSLGQVAIGNRVGRPAGEQNLEMSLPEDGGPAQTRPYWRVSLTPIVGF